MHDLSTNYPLSVIADAAGATLAKVAGFFAVCWLAFGVGMACVDPDPQALHFAVPIVGVPILWFWGIFLGLAQGWGFVSYVVLGTLGGLLLYSERQIAHLLFAIAAVQGLETIRMLSQWGEVGWLRVVAAAVALAAAYVVYWAIMRWVAAHQPQRTEPTEDEGRENRVKPMRHA